MYTNFFGLNEKPFAITPDPRYLYMSERHAEALAHLVYGINEAGGFVQLTGEVGTGKTTLLRTLLGQIPQNAEVAFILNPRVTPAEFLLTICEELHLSIPEHHHNSVKELVDALNRHLLEAHGRGRRVVVIVDEAQNLSSDVLEQVRLLTNLETPTQKLLQILLIGQPELREVLKRNDLRQLAQRITGRYHLSPLTRAETAGYVRHRLKVAGATGEVFTNGALREVHRLSRGIPRVINVICDRTLLGAYTQDRHRITGATVRRSVREIYGHPVLPGWTRWAAGGVVLAGAALLVFGLWQQISASEVAEIATKTPKTAVKGQLAVDSATKVAELPPTPPPTTQASPAPRQEEIKLEKLLATPDASVSSDASYEKLFAAWGAKYDRNTLDACQQAARQGLGCLMQRGSWGQLRAFNRPAILILTDDTGVEHQLLLSQLDDERATVEFSGRHVLSIADVSRYWFGDFLLLWRPQVAGGKQLSAGMRSDEVRWLRQSLEHVRGMTPTQTGADVYDDSLVKLVEDFQRDHRLTVDGIAGMQTQMLLDSALGTPGTPFLTASASHGS